MEEETRRQVTGAPPRSGWARMVVELHVNDLGRSLSFWRDVLGFQTAFERAEERFAYLEHPEGHQIMLCQRHGRFETGPLDQPLGQGAMFQIYLADIGPVLLALSVRNWAIYLGPREVWRRTGDRESGQKEIFVQDPDGYLVMVAHNIGERPLDAAQPGRLTLENEARMLAEAGNRQPVDRAIYHVSVGVCDMRKAREFYEAALAPLGCRLLYEFKDKNGADNSLGWGRSFPEFWTNLPLDGQEATVSNGAHIAFFAPDKSSVDRFYSAALSAGGRDDGSPGYRPDYQPGYYGAFVRDPDGNKLEAVWLDFEKKGTSLA